MARKPSGADVARAAGVSQTTVSFVLSGRSDIAIPEATRERVRQVARKLGYRANGVARSLSRGRTQTIGVIVPRLDSSFCGQIAQGIEDACIEANFHVLLAHTMHRPEVESRQIELLLEHRVDGLIRVVDEWTIAELPRSVEELVAEQVPCVLIDDRSRAGRVDCIVSDDVQGARLAVRHLLDLGHRRIAHVGAGDRTSTARDRAAGYREALGEAGIEVDEDLIVGRSFSMHSTAESVKSLCALSDPPTALFCANDRLAADTIQAFEEWGLGVPEDRAVVGYADMEFAHYLRLTSVHQHSERMGRLAVERLLRRIADSELAPETVVVPTRLVVRKSCGAGLNRTGLLAPPVTAKWRGSAARRRPG